MQKNENLVQQHRATDEKKKHKTKSTIQNLRTVRKEKVPKEVEER